MPPPSIPSQQQYDANLYSFPREQNGWPTTSSDAEGAVAGYFLGGPSRTGGDPYQPYAPPQRSSPIDPSVARQTLGRPQSGRWSSVYPSAATRALQPPGARSDNRGVGGGAQVKMEDLVSQARSRQGPVGKPSASPGGLINMPLNMPGPGQPDRKPQKAEMPQSGTELPGSGAGSAGGTSTAGGDGVAAGGASGGTSVPSEFIKKLYKMLEKGSATCGKGRAAAGGHGKEEDVKRGWVGWGRGGTSFVVWDINGFTTKGLPQTFRHSNFSSFVRQLNKYGFSKIKHVDEDTGQIKANIWEFQHPNFQAGGKAALCAIKRNAVAPKKGPTQADTEKSPSGARTGGALAAEDSMRLVELENRVLGLEDRCARTMDKLRELRIREASATLLFREMIGILAATERAPGPSMGANDELSARMMELYQLYDQLIQPNPNYYHMQGATPSQPMYTAQRPGMAKSLQGGAAYFSSQFDGSGSRTSGEVLPPAWPKIPRQGQAVGSGIGCQVGRDISGSTRGGVGDMMEDIIELPETQQMRYNGEPIGMNTMFFETPAWLTEGTTATLPVYHCKSSHVTTERLMVEALAGQAVGQFDEMQNPRDTGPTQTTTFDSMTSIASSRSQNRNGGFSTAGSNAAMAGPPGLAMPSIQQSLFGAMIYPPEASGSTSRDLADREGRNPVENVQLRRSTTIRPHWNKAPRILVADDQLVYRQLLSKFLEEFECITETVDNGQDATDKMNRTKYDLVLMDIFFGPSIDGRKATRIVRFDKLTPIISMTSHAQPQEVNSYLQSGMNDVLVKPFTKHSLFGILGKHLINLEAIQPSAEVPRSLGLSPLPNQDIVDAGAIEAAQLINKDGLRNRPAAMDWSDEAYQLVFQRLLATGISPDASAMQANDKSINDAQLPGGGGGSVSGAQIQVLPSGSSSLYNAPIHRLPTHQQGHLGHQQSQPQTAGSATAMGTNVLFGDNSGFTRTRVGVKRALEAAEDSW